MIYLGVDPTAGRRPLNYAILDSKLNIMVEGAGFADDLLRAIEPYPDIICAMDAPASHHRIHVRSASRLGLKDFGVNRKRIEGIRRLLNSQ